ncbi:MAG: Gfo/Idh/MocA family oxidoreductase [Bryobacteraceae bacterium]|nr:Gfo/Idh/MocA family oxidoreductase [Bryobacterales bacterium]MEB2360315.1 Gfo/Idh/MocA family oxidoreductase [Bryobacterales bacterium]NUM99542.1 Gfo/Idh/MocA family oxidoreductase [Bryobacteraceae bacterium]
MDTSSRRTFVKTAAGGAFLNWSPAAKGANEKVTLALVGARNQGRGVAKRAIQAGAQVKTICDIDEAIIQKVSPEIEGAQNRHPAGIREYRKVLDDKDIDAVIIATPDHWHTHMALLACQAGKDVYVEKPLSQTIEEGHLIRDAARKYNRVMQVGTQRRSGEHFREAAKYVASGKLGKVCLIKAWMCQVRESIGNPPNGTPPATADYDMWLGPAPKRPFNPNRFHYNWRFFWDYGNSELGNQGVHMLDVAVWAIQEMRGLENSLPKRISSNGGIYWLDDAKEVPDTQVVTYDYGDLLLSWELRSFARHHPIEGSTAATGYYGTEGTLILDGNGWRVYAKDGSPGPQMKSTGMFHEKNFLECVKSRQKPHSDVEIGRLSTTLCHLGNISHHLGRDVRFDPKTETFGDDAKANALLKKTYRASYPRPKV